jgi:hypothetical protein
MGLGESFARVDVPTESMIRLDLPMPTKLHLPIVCVVMALSNKKLSFVLALIIPNDDHQP